MKMPSTIQQKFREVVSVELATLHRTLSKSLTSERYSLNLLFDATVLGAVGGDSKQRLTPIPQDIIVREALEADNERAT